MKAFLSVLLMVAACTAPPSLHAQKEKRACAAARFEETAFTVCRLDAADHAFRLVVNDAAGAPLRSFAALQSQLGDEAQSVAFAMNAGMFNETGAPIGLYVENGETLRRLNRRKGRGNFHLEPNGVFSIGADGVARVETTDAFAERDATPLWATQSGPMLVIEAALHPAISPNGASRYIRNGVGVDAAGRAIFVISEAPVSFGVLARFFRDELKCANALYLDGAVSSLWDPSEDRMDSRAAIGPMFVVLNKPLKPHRSAPSDGPR